MVGCHLQAAGTTRRDAPAAFRLFAVQGCGCEQSVSYLAGGRTARGFSRELSKFSVCQVGDCCCKKTETEWGGLFSLGADIVAEDNSKDWVYHRQRMI